LTDAYFKWNVVAGEIEKIESENKELIVKS
jgi:hypothetical protein